jgi:hypothetical protein
VGSSQQASALILLVYPLKLRDDPSGDGMLRFLLAFFLIVSAGLAIALAAVLADPQVSTFEIDRDRTTLSSEISAVQAQSEQFGPGLLKSLIEARLAIAKNTLAMLDQKRTSFIRRISLNYRIDGQAVRQASDDELNMILEDLSQAERKATASKAEAARYTGGLLQSMTLLRAEADEMSVSQLRLKFYSAKHGIPILLPDLRESTKAPPTSPGKIVKDREAL